MDQTGDFSRELRALQHAIRRISRALEIQSRRSDRDFGLTLPQLAVLGAVRDLGDVTSRAIAQEAHLSPPTVVGILDKLEVKGMIERHRSRDDRRIVHIRLTEHGRAVLLAAPAPAGEGFRKGFSALSSPDRAAILVAFDTVAALLEGTGHAPDLPAGSLAEGEGGPGEGELF